jgi:hypothetical protein
MQALDIAKTMNSPKVFYDKGLNILSISGDSYPENSFEFYKPLFKWMNMFVDSNLDSLQIDFTLVYFNSTTSKVLYDFFDLLEEHSGTNLRLKVNWQYDPENELALESGEEYHEDYESLSINLVPLQA